MKLKTFNIQNTMVGTKNAYPFLSLCLKSGLIKLSHRLVQEMQCKEGDKIALSQDQEKPDNWYIHREENGFELKSKGKSNVDALGFSSKDLCRRILERTEFRENAITVIMNVDTNPLEVEDLVLYEIATKTCRKSTAGRVTADVKE